VPPLEGCALAVAAKAAGRGWVTVRGAGHPPPPAGADATTTAGGGDAAARKLESYPSLVGGWSADGHCSCAAAFETSVVLPFAAEWGGGGG